MTALIATNADAMTVAMTVIVTAVTAVAQSREAPLLVDAITVAAAVQSDAITAVDAVPPVPPEEINWV